MQPIRAAVGVLAVLTLVACGRPAPPSANPTPSQPAPTATATAGPSAGPSATPAPTSPSPTTTKPPQPTATTPAPPFPAALRGKDVERIPTSTAIVALTFDAGANADGLSSILATLAKEGVRATFFLTASFVNHYPDQCRRIVAAGHRIGNHSVDHPDFTTLSDAQMRAQLSGAASTIRATTGADPAPLFRFPYGARTAHTIAVVNAAGYVPVRWTVDSLGWQGTRQGTRDANFVAQRVLAAATPGEIAAMHVGSNPDDKSTLDAQALPAIIAGLRAKGYTFVTLNALLG